MYKASEFSFQGMRDLRSETRIRHRLRTDPSQPEADPSFGGLRRNLKQEPETTYPTLDSCSFQASIVGFVLEGLIACWTKV